MLVLLFDACRVMRPCPTPPAIPQAACCSRWQGASAPPGARRQAWRSRGTGAGAAPEGEKGCFLVRTDAVAALSAGCPSVALMLRIRARFREKPQCAERRWNEELGLSATQWHAGRSHGTSAKTSWHRREGVKLHSRTRTLGWSYVIARYVARRAVHRRSGYYPGRTVVSG